MTEIHQTPEESAVDPMRLAPGTIIELFDGDQLTVTENPRDGVWVFARPADAPADAPQPVYADDMKKVVAAPEDADLSEG